MQFQAPKLPLFELKGWKSNKNFLGVVLADKQIFFENNDTTNFARP